MSTQTAKNRQTVAIIPGFAEGYLTGRRMRKELAKRGFDNSKDPATADVIIAHSGGCFIIPAYAAAKLIICINPPHWPGKPLRESGAEKLRVGFAASRANKAMGLFIKAQIRNIFYLWNIPRYRKMWLGIKDGSAWRLQMKVVLIRNQNDTFSPDTDTLPFETDVIAVEVPGGHDDCWDNPKPYIDVLEANI
jgi:hypothetical protein